MSSYEDRMAEKYNFLKKETIKDFQVDTASLSRADALKYIFKEIIIPASSVSYTHLTLPTKA